MKINIKKLINKKSKTTISSEEALSNVNPLNYPVVNSVLGIARYTINRTIELGGEITTLKLQKILFYIQCEVLNATGKKCFEEDFVRNEYGAFQQDVCSEFKGNGRSSLDYQKTYLTIYFDENKENICCENAEVRMDIVSNEIREIIDDVITKYMAYDAFEMINLNLKHHLVENTKAGEKIKFENNIKERLTNDTLNDILYRK